MFLPMLLKQIVSWFHIDSLECPFFEDKMKSVISLRITRRQRRCQRISCQAPEANWVMAFCKLYVLLVDDGRKKLIAQEKENALMKSFWENKSFASER